MYAGDSISTAGSAPPGSLPNPGVAVCEKREFWEILFVAVAEEMASGTSIEDVPDSLLASTEFRTMFLDQPTGGEATVELDWSMGGLGLASIAALLGPVHPLARFAQLRSVVRARLCIEAVESRLAAPYLHFGRVDGCVALAVGAHHQIDGVHLTFG